MAYWPGVVANYRLEVPARSPPVGTPPAILRVFLEEC
jgi:hypothetical protein